MDVIGKHVVSLAQRRQAFLQTLERQPVGGINTGRPQDGNRNAVLPPPGPQRMLGIDPASGPRTFRLQATGFIDPGTATIAIDARRTNVNQTPW